MISYLAKWAQCLLCTSKMPRGESISADLNFGQKHQLAMFMFPNIFKCQEEEEK